MFCLPEHCKIVRALEPQAGGAVTGDYVSLKNVNMAWVVVYVTQAHVAQMAITIERATDVAPTGSVAINAVVPIWANEDCAASDLLVRQTDAVGFTLSAAQKHKIVVFQIDPASLGATYDCITVKTAASDATNITAAMYYLQERYAADQPPSAIID